MLRSHVHWNGSLATSTICANLVQQALNALIENQTPAKTNEIGKFCQLTRYSCGVGTYQAGTEDGS